MMNRQGNNKARPEKKSETLEVRLPYSVKQAFMRVAHSNGETASEVIREFIDQYLQDARQANHKTVIQEMIMTIDHNRKKTVALLTGFAAAALTLAALPSTADDDVFATFDKNGDGVLTPGEVADGDSGLIAALDRDGSGSVTPEEFESQARVMRVELDQVGENGAAVPVSEPKVILVKSEDGDLHAAVTMAVEEGLNVVDATKRQEIIMQITEGMETGETETTISVDSQEE